MRSRGPLFPLAIAGIMGLVAACAAPDITAPDPGGTPEHLLGFGNSNPSLITCPSTETVSTSDIITTAGGTLSVGGLSIVIPAGALLQDANVTVSVPASRYLEVDISVEGSEHFVFELPVVVTISYARCSRSNINLSFLSAWHIDTETKALLEKMPSIDNKLLRTVTFTTGHLSGYAIAN